MKTIVFEILKQVNLGHFSKAIYQTNCFYRFIYLFIYLSFQSSLRPQRRCVRLAHLQRHLRAGQRPVRVQVNQHALVYDFPILALDYLIVFLLIQPDFLSLSLICLSNYLSIYLYICIFIYLFLIYPRFTESGSGKKLHSSLIELVVLLPPGPPHISQQA